VQLLAGQRLQRATFDFSESDEVIVILEIVSHSPDRQDFDTYKYFAQNRLRLLKSKANCTASECYNEVQTIAFSCSLNRRYKEALALLQESLADLQASAPQSDSVGWCLYTLARISEDSGDLPAACRYYERQKVQRA
jgi:hypothetical protein